MPERVAELRGATKKSFAEPRPLDANCISRLILPGSTNQAVIGVPMNYKSELQRLQRLLHADYNAYLDELDKPWSSMDEDLDLAIKILRKHASASDGRLPLLEACKFPDDPREEATVTLPEWLFEIITTFGDLYEPSEAEYRTQKVFNELIGKRMGRGEIATRH